MAAFSNHSKVCSRTLSCRLRTMQQKHCSVQFLSIIKQPVASSSNHNLASKSLFLTSHPSCGLHTSATRGFHTSQSCQDLMEFFDDKDVWGEQTVTTGRPYRLDELRIKSNEDLHKLWYVLLKERNMLLTMEAEYTRLRELFPNPERIEKVEESMENILEVVKERDNAVSLLETGKPSEPGGAYIRDFLGRLRWRNFREYAVPPHMNKVYRLLNPRGFNSLHLKYLPLWREKLAKRRWYEYHRQLGENRKLVQKFPHLEGKLNVEKPEEPPIN